MGTPIADPLPQYEPKPKAGLRTWTDQYGALVVGWVDENGACPVPFGMFQGSGTGIWFCLNAHPSGPVQTNQYDKLECR